MDNNKNQSSNDMPVSNGPRPTAKPNVKSKRKPLSPLAKFFAIVGGIVGVFIIVSGAAVFGYMKTNDATFTDAIGSVNPFVPPPTSGAEAPGSVSSTPDPSAFNTAVLPPKKTNILIMGTNEGLSDVDIVASFDRDTGAVSLVSVPRDTYIVLGNSDIQSLQAAGYHPPSNGAMKLTELHNYAGKLGNQYVEKQVEAILGIKIDYYIEIDTQALRQIVDSVGGVWVTVRDIGYDYDDPAQNLSIHLKGGYQLLDGAQAEGLLRFREGNVISTGYANGDLERITVQQDFLKQMFSQVLTKQNIIGNLPDFISVVIKYVKTDFSLTDLTKYVRYINSLNADNFATYTVPGTAGDTTLHGYKAYVYYVDADATAELVQKVFFDSPAASPTPASTPVSSATAKPSPTPDSLASYKTLRVEVLNGSGKNGKASAVDDMLTADGFNVTAIGNYSGTQTAHTRIMSRTGGMLDVFGKYFKNPQEELDPTGLTAGFDVIIVVGTED